LISLRFIRVSIALLALASLPSWALIDYTDAQRETMVELIEQLEERHYAKLEYEDSLSSQHLDNYLESLDSSKMFFLAPDIVEFEKVPIEERLPFCLWDDL